MPKINPLISFSFALLSGQGLRCHVSFFRPYDPLPFAFIEK